MNMEDDIPPFTDNRKDKRWIRSENRCWDNTEEDHEKAKIPLNSIKQLQTEEVKVGEEVTGEIEHSVGQFAKTLPKQPVTTGEHDPIQFDNTVVNNVNIKVKSLVAVDGVENITREGKKITDVYPHITDVTITGGGGNSYGFRKYRWFLGLVILCFGRVNGNPIADWQSDSKVLDYGKTWNLTCSNNHSFVNETFIWSRRNLKSETETETIIFLNKPKNSTKFETDGARGSTLVIKNVNKEDIWDYCYYCRIGNTPPSRCKYIFEINVNGSCNNTKPPNQCKDPMSNCTEVVSGDYKCTCNPGYYNRGGTCTITDQKGDNDKTGLIVGIVVGCVGLVAIVIVVFLCCRRKGGYFAASTKE